MEIIKNRKIRIALLFFLLLSFTLIVIGIYKSTQNPYGEELDISNLKNYTANKPTNDEVLDYIKHDLYKTVNFNTKNKLKNNSVKDIIIRDKSFSQVYNRETGVHTIHFIVDIESLKQSYEVSYQWSDKGKYNQEIEEYGTKVFCLPINKLKYSDFNCIDEQALERGKENYDPIGKIIPHHVRGKYKIIEYEKFSEGVILNVEAYTSRGDLRPSSETLKNYTDEINQWITANKLKPSDYMITFLY